jgi:hypothetical protein
MEMTQSGRAYIMGMVDEVNGEARNPYSCMSSLWLAYDLGSSMFRKR